MKNRSIRTAKIRHFGGKSSWTQGAKTLGLVTVTSLLIITTACGQNSTTNASSVSSTKATPSATPSPTPSKVAGTACTPEKATQSSSGETYVCVVDRTGKLAWMDSATAKKLTDERITEAAAKEAAERAAAEKAAADKAAADKAAADQAAAAAAKAAADKAAADKAAADAAAAAVIPKAAPAAPQAQSGCDPNYSGCVPIASDVDCAGGKGNGPAYVRGPVTVTGSDIYGLDSDGDGIACEK